MRALHKLLIQFSHTHTQTVQIIQRPQIEYRERDRNRSMRHSIQTHTQNSQCRINGEESERYKMQPRGTRVSGGLPTLSFSRRSSLYRRPHTQSDPADGGLSMLVAFHAKPFAQKLDQKSRDCDLDDGWSAWRLLTLLRTTVNTWCILHRKIAPLAWHTSMLNKFKTAPL